MAIGDNMRAILSKAGYAQDPAAKKLGISQPRLNQWLNNKRIPDIESIENFCKVFNITLDELLNYKDEDGNFKKLTLPDNIVKIDILDVVACCGNGVENFSENVIGQHMMTLTALRELTSAAPENIKIIRAVGDSMTPTIRPGEMLWIDVSYTCPTSDGLYLIRIGHELVVRRIQLNPFDGSAVIKADNEAYRAFPAESFEAVPVLGRVIYHVVRMV